MGKKRFLASICTLCMVFSLITVPAFAAEKPDTALNPNLIISTREDVTVVPSNVQIALAGEPDSVKFDHNSEIKWNKGDRRIEADTQATQGTIKLSSYTRCRYERPALLGGNYGDSGRVWSVTEGARSYAKSSWETFQIDTSGVAHSYYGI